MVKLINWLSEILYEKPWRFILVSLTFCALMIPQLLTLESDFGVRIWFKTDDPLIQELNELEQRFGNDERILLAMHSKSGIFNQKNLDILEKITDKMWLVPEVSRGFAR